METFFSDDNLKWPGTVGSNMPITLTFVALDGGANFGKVPFSVFVYNIFLMWSWESTRSMRLNRWVRSRRWCSLMICRNMVVHIYL